MISVLAGQPSFAFSEPHNQQLALVIDSANCANVRSMVGGSSTSGIAANLEDIPDSTTIAQAGLTHPDLSGSARNQRIIDAYRDRNYMHIFTNEPGANSCGTLEQLLRYGMSLKDGSTTGGTSDNQAALTTAIAPMRQGWINEICNDSTDPQCPELANQQINQLVVACASASPSLPTIRSFDDLSTCAGGSKTFAEIEEEICTSSGGTFESGTCTAASAEEAPATCVIEHGLGWILCPVMNTLAAINDGAWLALEKFLVSPTMTTDDASGYGVWVMMRNIANVLFVLFFLVIVYSQITSVGISNYGIKKLLPKLIVGAILVNASWIIVAGAVDLSNVLGKSLYSINGSLVSVANERLEGSGEGGTPNWQYAAGGLLMGAIGSVALVMAGLTVALPLLLGAFIFVGGLVIVLTFRNALVLILAVLAPIAFVAYLLPGTNGFFKTWYTMFKAVLLIYPAAAIAMGMSNVAAAVTWNNAQSSNDWIMMFIAAAMPAMGIVLALLVAKTMGSVMSRFGVNNPLGGVINSAKKGAAKFGEGGDKGIATWGSGSGRGRFSRQFGRMGGYRRRAIGDMKDQATDARFQAATLGTKQGIKANRSLGGAQQVLSSAKVKAELDELEENKDLHLNAVVDNLRLDAAKAEFNAEVAEESARAGSAANAATQQKFLQDMRTESANRETRSANVAAMTEQEEKKDEYGNPVIEGGRPVMQFTENAQRLQKIAGGIGGTSRVTAGALGAQSKENAEAVANHAIMMEHQYGADGLLEGAAKEYIAATRSGDTTRARAAAKILGTQTGSAGLDKLQAAIAQNDIDPTITAEQKANITSVTRDIKQDLNGFGLKGKNRVLDEYARTNDTGTIAATISNVDVGALNQTELAGQSTTNIKEWIRSGQLTQSHALAIMAAHDKGTLPLDDKKREHFSKLVSDPNYKPPN